MLTTGLYSICSDQWCGERATVCHSTTGQPVCSKHASQIGQDSFSQTKILKPSKSLENRNIVPIQPLEDQEPQVELIEDPHALSSSQEQSDKKITPCCIGCSVVTCAGLVVGVYFAVLGMIDYCENGGVIGGIFGGFQC